MSDASNREWEFYLDDMIDFAEKVLFYNEGFDRTGFVTNRLVYDATLRNLELIGEAASHIPEAILDAHDEIPWIALHPGHWGIVPFRTQTQGYPL